jgi:pimeloyl-ACP methyl ester carboxylesterase
MRRSRRCRSLWITLFLRVFGGGGMALLQVNANGSWPDAGTLAAALEPLAPGAPVVVMIHGYRFAPGVPGHCPHDHILSPAPRPGARRALSWPQHLGLTAPAAGLGVGFGWQARGTIWGAYGRAARAGGALARLVAMIAALRPGQPVDMIAHSFGARVALSALRTAPAGAVGRVILLSAAEFRGPALAAMASPAGRGAEVVNVVSRENDMFDFGMETLLRGGLSHGLGHGLCNPSGNWVDLQIDHPGTVAALHGLGFPLSAGRARVCHWSVYLRAGVFPLYRALIDRSLDLPTLRAALPDRPEPRWASLRADAAENAALPLRPNPA